MLQGLALLGAGDIEAPGKQDWSRYIHPCPPFPGPCECHIQLNVTETTLVALTCEPDRPTARSSSRKGAVQRLPPQPAAHLDMLELIQQALLLLSCRILHALVLLQLRPQLHQPLLHDSRACARRSPPQGMSSNTTPGDSCACTMPSSA